MSQANVEIYFSPLCGYCVMAKRLLDNKQITYNEINVIQDPNKREEMLSRANGQTTVPQIFIDQQHIGGYTDIAALDEQGELDALLYPTASE